MYDDSNTDSCDVTVIATGIGSKDTVEKNYVFNNQNTRKNNSQMPSFNNKGYQGSSQTRSSVQNTRPVNNSSVKGSIKQESLDIPSFLRNPRR
jgi:cell division protein FtsZ